MGAREQISLIKPESEGLKNITQDCSGTSARMGARGLISLMKPDSLGPENKT